MAEELKIFDDLKNFLKEYIGNDNNSAYWLELLSSIHFLVKTAYIFDKTKYSIINKLKEKKGNKFENDDITRAWTHLQKNNLISF